jgi:large subunit ribosomal protein L10
MYFTKYTGMSVEQATLLRQNFSDNSVEFLVSKNTLTKLASEKAGFEKDLFDDFLLGQIAIAYAKEDPTAPAKVINDFHKENECLEVVGLYFDGELHSPEKYKEIAALPSKDILLTKFVIGMNYPMTSVVYCLKSTMSKVMNVLQAIKEQKD